MWASIINLGGSFGILIALVWVTMASMRLIKALQLAKVAEEELNGLSEKMEEEIAKADENKIKITRELEKLEIARDRGLEALAKMEEELSPEAMAKRERHYVMADRRAPNEPEWLVQISCPSGAGRHWHPYYVHSWANPRSYLCWAPNAEAARRMADSRFPPNGGFLIGHIAPPATPLTPQIKA